MVDVDSSVPAAFGSLGAVGPGQCAAGDLYLDAPVGSQRSSLSFA